MPTEIELVLARYERGEMNRPQFLQTLAEMVRTAADSWPHEAPQTAVTIDHVTVRVDNLQETARFYESVFGIRAERKTPKVYYIRVGNSFLGLIDRGQRPAGFDHFCLGVKDFDLPPMAARLQELGLRAEGEITPRLHDPDGIEVQFGATTYARRCLRVGQAAT